MSRHIIHKQTVTLELTNPGDSNLFQDKVSHLLHNGVSSAMEAVFDKISDHDEIIRIDRLELDLGTITTAGFEAEFRTRLIEELTRALPTAKSEAAAASNI